MLKRFYFDLVNRETILPDEVGVEAADLDEALEEAASALEELRDSGEAADLGEGWQLLIRDRAGTILRRLTVAASVLLSRVIQDPGGICWLLTDM